MKTSRYLISIFVTYLTLGLVGILSADVADNNIVKYPPVYDASSMDQTAIKDTDPFGNIVTIARVVVKLEKPANVAPSLPTTLERTFLGYSDKNSNLQLYIKPLTLYELFWGSDRPFGKPIPLAPGSYIIEDENEELRGLHVTLTVSLEDLEIKTSSGWFASSYEKASVYVIRMKVSRH